MEKALKVEKVKKEAPLSAQKRPAHKPAASDAQPDSARKPRQDEEMESFADVLAALNRRRAEQESKLRADNVQDAKEKGEQHERICHAFGNGALCPTVAKSGVYRRIRRKRGGQNLFQAALCAILCLVYHRVFRCNLDYLPRIRAAAQVSLAHTLVRLLIYMIVLFVLYVIVVLVFRYALHASDSILRKIGMAAFNTLVLAIPVINRSAAYTVGESLGAGLGAGAAFALAVFLIHAGIHVLDRNDKIPKAFQGTPALFIYVSLLALAFTGFSGRSLFI